MLPFQISFLLSASLLILEAVSCSSFNLAASSLSLKRSHPSPYAHHIIMIRNHFTLNQKEDDFDQDDYEGEEIFISPKQIKVLRKEATKRDANNRLPKFFLSPEESMDPEEETIEKIADLFDTSELVQVRGISRDRKKHVYDTTREIAATLEDILGRPVVLVEINGFAAKLYCPYADDNNEPNKIDLWTSYKPNQWTKKAKPVRDSRGQIMKDESGKSIKEIPE